MKVDVVLARLCQATAAHHAQADEDRLALLDADSAADYRSCLARIYGLEVPVELAMAKYLALPSHRGERLRRDLQALGLDDEAISMLPAFDAVIGCEAQALGWLLVLERHVLLAGLLCRDLERRLAVPTAYLSVDSPGAHLRELGARLACADSSSAEIITAAHEAFRAQKQWYRGWSEPVGTRDVMAIQRMHVAVLASITRHE